MAAQASNFNQMNSEQPKKRRRWILPLALVGLVGASFYVIPTFFPETAASIREGANSVYCFVVSGCPEDDRQLACMAAIESGDKALMYAFLENNTYDESNACDQQLMAVLDSIECATMDMARDARKAYSDYLTFFGTTGQCYDDVKARLQDLECEIVAQAGPSDCIPQRYDPSDCADIVRCLDQAQCEVIMAKPNNRQVYLEYIYTYGALGQCYPQIFAKLDSMDCAAAKKAKDKKKAYYSYIDFFGEAGSCTQAFQEEINDCALAEDADDCTQFAQYIAKYGADGLCADYFMERVKAKNCQDVFDYELAIASNDPDALEAYLRKNVNNQNDPRYNRVKEMLEAALCDRARAQKKCYYYADYLERYGRDGDCSREFASILAADYDKTIEEIYTMNLATLCPNTPDAADYVALKTLPGSGSQGAAANRSTTGSKYSKPVCRTFTTRDNQRVNAIKLGPLWFMTDNLNMSQTNPGYSTLLTWHEAQSACPEGWRLPCEQEILFYQEAYYTNSTNAYNGLINLQDCGFSSKLFEPYYNQNLSSYFGNGVVAHWWLATEASDLNGYSWGLDRNTNMLFIRTSTNKDKKLPCRCVRESDEYSRSQISIVYKGCPNRPKPWLKS